MRNLSLTYNEFEILRVLWEEGHSLSRPEILERLPEKDWNSNSIHLILNNMIKKGVLEVDGLTRCGRGYGRTYAPVMSQLDYAASESLRLTPNLPTGKRVVGVVAALVEQEEVTAETILELEKMLAERKKELGMTE